MITLDVTDEAEQTMSNNSEGSSGSSAADKARDAFAKAKAAAAPKVAKAREDAGPKVEKAAARAGGLLGQLRDRAKDTAKGFSDGYGASGQKNRPEQDGDTTPGDDRHRPRPNSG